MIGRPPLHYPDSGENRANYAPLAIESDAGWECQECCEGRWEPRVMDIAVWLGKIP